MNQIFKTALSWLHQGIAPIPIQFRDKRPVIRWREFQKRLPSKDEVKSWFSAQRNLAIVTGWRNLIVVDFDDFQTFNDWQVKSDLPSTYSVLTARGIHCYYFLKNPISGFALPGIDIKANGGYVLVPPSIHPSGTAYVPLDKSTPILSVDDIGDILDVPSTTQVAKPKPIWGNGRGDLVSRVKKSYPILDFFPSAKKSGDHWYKTLCPFHDDHNESFWIDPSRDLCGCFAGCTEKPFDVIDLYAVLNNMSIEEAIADMQDRLV